MVQKYIYLEYACPKILPERYQRFGFCERDDSPNATQRP